MGVREPLRVPSGFCACKAQRTEHEQSGRVLGFQSALFCLPPNITKHCNGSNPSLVFGFLPKNQKIMLPFQHLDSEIIFCTGPVLREEVPSKQKDTSETWSCPPLISAVPRDRLAVVSRQEPQAEMRSRGEGWREGCGALTW